MSSHVSIWQFKLAPSELRALCPSNIDLGWIALVPSAIYGPDIEDAILAQSGNISLFRRTLENGDVIFTGSSSMAEALCTLTAHTGPELSIEGQGKQ
jgi:hypothetical protein